MTLQANCLTNHVFPTNLWYYIDDMIHTNASRKCKMQTSAILKLIMYSKDFDHVKKKCKDINSEFYNGILKVTLENIITTTQSLQYTDTYQEHVTDLGE